MVVGGGIVGAAVALSLLERHPLRLAVLEAEANLAAHQTGHNSGVIHSGLYYKPGSLKARTCAEGREAMVSFCESEGIPFRRCGKLVVATRERELPALAELERRGLANGLPGVTRLDPSCIREHEPEAAGLAGLWVPETGVVDYRLVVAAMARRIEAMGRSVLLGTRVLKVHRDGAGLEIVTSMGTVRSGALINCAGYGSDRLARACGLEPEVAILPFRGDYFHLERDRSHLVRALIYPVPDPALPFLGVHFTRGIDGSVEVGPNAVPALSRTRYSGIRFDVRDAWESAAFPGTWRLLRRHWRSGLDEILRAASRAAFARDASRLVPAVKPKDLVRGGCGIRAQAVGRDGRLIDDFHILEGERSLHVLNAPSPAATASLAIGREVARRAATCFGWS